MTQNNSLFKFPKSIPNDIEGFMAYYPWKFPGIVLEYEKSAEKYHLHPEEFRKFSFAFKKELNIGVRRMKKKYESDRNHSLEFLVELDEKISKLYCYRFWIINYLFCDGPLHTFYVDKIREYVRKVGVAPGVELETEEAYLKEMERNLLQGDYADVYLMNALAGIKVMDILENYREVKEDFKFLKKAVSEKNNQKTYKLIDKIVARAEKNKETNHLAKSLINNLLLVLNQVKMRKNRFPLYTKIIHDIEFYEQNKELKRKHRKIKREIKKIFELAKEKLSAKEYSEFKTCSLMSSELSESKDTLGETDLVLLPFWFDVLYEIQEKLPCSKKHKKDLVKGVGSIFYSLVWYLPPELKAKVFTPDESPFELKKF